MSTPNRIIIAGAGGIGQAVALILAEFSDAPYHLYVGNRTLDKARHIAQWLTFGTTRGVRVEPFGLSVDNPGEDFRAALREASVLLDCLPGSLAPRLAALAREYGLHYANLTEYVDETAQIMDLARNAGTGFLLQTGLAPGFVNVLANGLFRRFCRRFEVEQARRVCMRVGALTRNATAPHFYGFTWSPAGVATEYTEHAWCVRQHRKVLLPALSERETLILNGIAYEADLTSGGAADLPDALAEQVEHLDYKTLRYPGHYDWVLRQLDDLPAGAAPAAALQQRMEALIPHVEDDLVLVYAWVEGPDHRGHWQRLERSYYLRPQWVGRHLLRAIQTTTAAPLAEAAHLLLQGNHQGAVLQSQIDPEAFLNGRFVSAVYGKWDGESIPGSSEALRH